ncbi:pyridoxal phosphate-dependent transferase [Gautieria morchelliformis]|nr:pyridoxal phosphate-dependent transferase [Gautieria morchelliformis]
MDTLQSTRELIFKLAGDRDTRLHTLSTVADPHDVQAALEALPPSLPERGLGPQEALKVILRDVIPGLAPGHLGPRYFGFITGGTLPSSQLADFLTTIYDQNAGSNRAEESITAVIESRALEFVLDLFRLPRDKFPARTLTTGATAANILGLALGRDYAVRHALASSTHSVSEDGFGGVTVKVYSDRPHASLLKAAATVGIGRANVIDLGKIIGDSGTIGIELGELEKYLKEAAPGSGTAAIVSLSFGEVSTGDFTPNVHAIRALCNKYSVWLHIDAAFGAYARLVPDVVGHLAEGLELADSIASDAHKWLNVPYDCGLFFSRSVEHQSSVFGPSPAKGVPAYLMRAGPLAGATPELEAALRIPDPMNISIENSRRFRALPLYTALLDQGRAGYTDIVRRNILFIRQLAAWMGSAEGKGYYEVLNLRKSSVPPASGAAPTTPLNMLLFRAASSNPVKPYVDTGGAALLVRAINDTRKVQVTPGAGAVRIAVSNWCTGLQAVKDGQMEKSDLEIVIDVLLAIVEHPPTWISS